MEGFDQNMKLTDREHDVVFATIRLWNINLRLGYIPDNELSKLSKFSFLSMTEDEMREIRDLVQEVNPKGSKRPK